MTGRRTAAMMALFLGAAGGAAAQGSNSAVCKVESQLASLPALPEASGLAAGRRGSRLWMHNDSGAPELIAVEPTGSVAGRVTLSGARVEDWEALASGRCGSGSCLYVGDIGDNDAERKQITIYRLAEPDEPSGTVKAESFHGTYPDGPQDAEALLLAPDGTLLIVSKGETGPIAVYKFPAAPKVGTTMQLERVGEPIAEKQGADGRVTDGAFSADGRWVVLRTKRSLTFYPGAGFLRGEFKQAHRFDLSSLGEPQGEAVAFGPGGAVYVGGEGGGKKQPGTLATLTCHP